MHRNITAARRHSLPNKDFAVPENEGLPIDTTGRTRAAMARFNQYDFDSRAQAKRAFGRITSRAKRFGIDDSNFKNEYRGVKMKNPRAQRRRNAIAGLDADKIKIVNPDEALAAARSTLKIGYQPNPGNLWIFSFGAYGDSHYAYWDDGIQHLEGSLEEVAGYLAENAPGLLTSEEEMFELYKEAAEDAGIPWPIEDWDDPAAEKMRESAETDMTYTESGWLTSYEWFVNEVDTKDPLFGELFEISLADAFEEEGMDDEEVEEANEVAEKLGIEARWEAEPEDNPGGALRRLEIYDPQLSGWGKKREVRGYNERRKWFYEDGSPIEVGGIHVTAIKGYRDNPHYALTHRQAYDTYRAMGLSAKLSNAYAKAEKWAFENDITFETEYDYDQYDPDFGPWILIAKDADGEPVASVGGLTEEQIQGDDLRLHEAELADEAMYHATKKNPLGASRRNSGRRSNPADNEFQEGVAKALWAILYATEVDELREDGYGDLADELSPGGGGDWMDVLPPIPEAAYDEARDFEKAVIEANKVKDIDVVIAQAADADGVDGIDEEEFGHFTMMPALGHGVNWFDDHNDFGLKLPHWEQSSEVHNAMYEWLEEQKKEHDE